MQKTKFYKTISLKNSFYSTLIFSFWHLISLILYKVNGMTSNIFQPFRQVLDYKNRHIFHTHTHELFQPCNLNRSFSTRYLYIVQFPARLLT